MTRPLPSAEGSRFWALWRGCALSNLSDGIVKAVLPLLAIQFTRKPSLVVAVTVANTLPWGLLGLPAGVLADRVDRRKLIVGANIVRCLALTMLTASIVVHVGGFTALCAVALVLGACETLADTTTTSFVPAVVGRDQLEWANSRLMGAESVLNQFVGPPLGALLIAISAPLTLGGSAATYLLAASSFSLLTVSLREAPTKAAGLWSEIRDGLAFLWRHELLRTIALMVAVMASAWGAWGALLVLYVVRPGPVGLGTFGYGVMLMLSAIGALTGTLLAGSAKRAIGRRGVLVADVAATFTMLAVPALSRDATAIGIATFVGGLGSGMWGVVVVSLRQSVTPDAYLGRVTAAARVIGWATIPVGAAFGGLAAGAFGIRAVFGVGALLVAGLILPLLPVILRDESLGRPKSKLTRGVGGMDKPPRVQ
jgi:predicted MFS family arabinose efflux permease